jgi:hypothetical protein
MVAILLALGITGCHTKADTYAWETGNVPEEDSAVADSDSDSGGDEHLCDEVSLDLLGPDAPKVGDSWTIWVNCDDSRLLGPLVIRFDPIEFASLADNVATFQVAGTAELTVRSGTYELSTEVTVTE